MQEGEQVKGADIRLGQDFSPRHLNVRVTWSDGRVIKSFVFVKVVATSDPTARADVKQHDLKAALLDVNILPDESYSIMANLTCRYADERSMGPGAQLSSNQVHIGPNDGVTELTLTIPGSGCPEMPDKRLLTEQ